MMPKIYTYREKQPRRNNYIRSLLQKFVHPDHFKGKIFLLQKQRIQAPATTYNRQGYPLSSQLLDFFATGNKRQTKFSAQGYITLSIDSMASFSAGGLFFLPAWIMKLSYLGHGMIMYRYIIEQLVHFMMHQVHNQHSLGWILNIYL